MTLRLNRCPHLHLRGVYGDEINHTPGHRRIRCIDCGRALDGHVRIAETRKCDDESCPCTSHRWWDRGRSLSHDPAVEALRAKHRKVQRPNGTYRCTSCRDAYGGHADWPTGTDRLIYPSEEL